MTDRLNEFRSNEASPQENYFEKEIHAGTFTNALDYILNINHPKQGYIK